MIIEPPRAVDSLDLDALAPGRVHALWCPLAEDGFGRTESVPVLVARGRRDGPLVGITAAVHGDELNGIPAIHRLFEGLDLARLRGTVVAVLVVNVAGFDRKMRHVEVGRDLNSQFPGRPDGHTAAVIAHRLLDRYVGRFQVLLDLHTASRGRVNSLYVRADMTDPATARMAYLQRPQIIVHNPPSDGTLRGQAAARGITAITVEIGDPQRFQPKFIKRTAVGLRAVLSDLGMVSRRPVALGDAPILCRRSRWVYTDRGGLLTVMPQVTDHVVAGAPIAHMTDVFGRHTATWTAPFDAVVVGRAVDPVARTGARIAHLGVLAQPDDPILVRPDVLPDFPEGDEEEEDP